jgi:hypothetical protein
MKKKIDLTIKEISQFLNPLSGSLELHVQRTVLRISSWDSFLLTIEFSIYPSQSK